MQKQSVETTGDPLTDNNRRGDIYEHIVIVEAMKRGANVYKNVGCTGKTDMILEHNNEKLSIDVKASSTHKCPSPGVALVHVDVGTLSVKWGRPSKAPNGWEGFWS